MGFMKKEITKIAAGGNLKCKKKDGIIGAVIKYQNHNCVLTAYHILRVGKCKVGDHIQFHDFKGRVLKIIWEYDLALVHLNAPESAIEFSKIGKPEIGPAYAFNTNKEIPCSIMTVGKTFHYLSFPFSNLPLPGDSGSPIIQEDKVVGILASIFFNNAAGIAVSIEKFRLEAEKNKNRI